MYVNGDNRNTCFGCLFLFSAGTISLCLPEIRKSTGVVRKLDDLGRITLPIELRRNLNIGEHDPLEIFVDDDRIILRKYEASDIFTGNMDELIDFHDKKVSKQSIMEMARLAGLHVIEGV